MIFSKLSFFYSHAIQAKLGVTIQDQKQRPSSSLFTRPEKQGPRYHRAYLMLDDDTYLHSLEKKNVQCTCLKKVAIRSEEFLGYKI